MKFFTDVKQEYNEMMGESEEDEKEEKHKEIVSEEDFQNLISDIKKDLKKIPKEDVWPVFPDTTKEREEKSEVVEESEFDIKDAKRALHLGEQQKKLDKKCRVGDKIYDVGDRWMDEGTGKEMICILMNIPKEVQPTLADVDISFSSDPEKITVEDTQWNRPSVEPQWSYTAYPSKKPGQTKPIKEKCTPEEEDNEGIAEKSNLKVDQSNQFQNQQEHITKNPEEEDKHYVSSKETEDILPNEKDESRQPAETLVEPATEEKEEPAEMLKKPEVIMVDKSESTDNTDESEDDNSESDDGSEYEIGGRKRPFKTTFNNKNDTKNKAETKEDKPTNKDQFKNKITTEQINETTHQEKNNNRLQEGEHKSVRAPETPELSKEQVQTSSDQISKDDKSSFDCTDETLKNDDEEKININKPLDDSESLNTNENYNTNSLETSNEDNKAAEESGKKIFMKETVVKHRKLLRTEETIETFNSDKN